MNMTARGEKFMLHWKDQAYNLSAFFKDLLEHKELVDVTLVADGYLFSAHRLVLSSVSPYFRKMFSQMPANQQAFGMALEFISNSMSNYILKFNYLYL